MNFDIYCDESRPDLFTTRHKEKDHYLLIGGLWLPTEKRTEIKETIGCLKNKHKVGGQLKWQKVSYSRLNFYQQIVDLFVTFGQDLRFRCIAVEADKANFKLFHDDDAELGFYKFYYELIHHWILDFNNYRIFCDTKTNRQPDRLATLQQCLRRGNISSQILSIQSVPARESVLIQLVDFLLGAVGSAMNNSLCPESAKANALQYLQNRLGRAKLGPTRKNEEKFNIFKIQLQGGW